MLAKDFEKQSGIAVKIRNGEGPSMAAQIVAEGAATPADVYFTENSPELMLLEEKGLLNKVDGSTLATGGTVQDVEEWPDRIRAVTADQVKAVAAKYLDMNRSVAAYLLPAASQSSAQASQDPAQPSQEDLALPDQDSPLQ